MDGWAERLGKAGACKAKVRALAALCSCLDIDPREPGIFSEEDRLGILNYMGDAAGPAPVAYQLESILQVVDLRAPSGTRPGSLVTLYDHYRLHAAGGNAGEFRFTHATSGQGIVGTCLVPSAGGRWEPLAPEASGGPPTSKWKEKYWMCVPHGPTAAGECEAVLARMQFHEAFTRDDEWFEIGIEHPTSVLTILVIFDRGKVCREIRGMAYKETGATSTKLEVPQPRPLQDGTLAFWHVEKPRQHFTYRLDWSW